MCGRMSITQPLEAMARLFDATLANDLPVVPNYNVCPTVNIHTVVSAQGCDRWLGALPPSCIGLDGGAPQPPWRWLREGPPQS